MQHVRALPDVFDQLIQLPQPSGRPSSNTISPGFAFERNASLFCAVSVSGRRA